MIDVRNTTHRRVRRAALSRTAQRLLDALDQGDADLSISLVGDAKIRTLNRTHRGKDRPTDVLSFPLDPPPAGTGAPERLLGDVVISLDTAARQAAEYGASLENEVYRLLIHGTLHVLGHDHEEPGERAAMEAEERRLAAVIGMPWPYD